MLMGFAEDVKQILMNVPQELVLKRCADDSDVIYNSVTTEEVKLIITNIVWRVPHVKVGISRELALTKLTTRNTLMELFFRGWEIHENPGTTRCMSTHHSIKSFVASISIVDNMKYILGLLCYILQGGEFLNKRCAFGGLWTEGYTPLSEFDDIVRKLCADAEVVCVKGKEKKEFLSRILDKRIVDVSLPLRSIPPFLLEFFTHSLPLISQPSPPLAHSTPIAEALPQQSSVLDFFNSTPEAFHRSMCEGHALLIEQVKMLLESRKGLSDVITFANACLSYCNGVSNMSNPPSHINDTIAKYQQIRDALVNIVSIINGLSVNENIPK
ncbi:hypothetical protein QE152_g25827 [Popillia japonica]|uniref:Double jelly roll-like domain-containing protein n=1 Tax=Popillia japonica TaxID=7064 RepID=A0AAW1K1P5_POPJA